MTLLADLFQAVDNNDPQTVEKILKMKNSPSPDSFDDDGYTPLCNAALNNFTSVIEVLLKYNADVNKATDREGFTPVSLAASNGHEKALQLLIAAKADINKTLNMGGTPVFIAAQYGHEKALQLLIAAKADINKATNSGGTPVYVAAQNGHGKVLQLLIAAKADINQAANDGITPVYIAAETGQEKALQLLINAGADINKAMNNGATPVFAAAERGHLAAVKLLYEGGANVSIKTRWGTALEGAKKVNRQDVVRFLENPPLDSKRRRDEVLHRPNQEQLLQQQEKQKQLDAEKARRELDQQRAEQARKTAEEQKIIHQQQEETRRQQEEAKKQQEEKAQQEQARKEREEKIRQMEEQLKIKEQEEKLAELQHKLAEKKTISQDQPKQTSSGMPTIKFNNDVGSKHSATSSSSSTQSPSLSINSDIAKQLQATYLIDYSKLTFGKELGHGGFGVVCKGTYNHGEVAIKKLLVNKMTATTEEEFKNETSIMANSRHPNIVTLFGYTASPSPYCMVMEIMTCSLFDVLHNGRDLPWTMRFSIARDIIAGLAHLHDNHIIHRDMKSLNVLLNDTMRAKLADFGLSKLKSETKTTTKVTEGSVGTIQWMAPELFGLKPKYSQKSDIYGYAMLMWELSSREVPYMDVESQVIISEVKQGNREEVPEDCPPKMSSLISFCWMQDSAKRPTAHKIAEYLQSDAEEFKADSAAASSSYRGNLESSPYLNNVSSTR